MATLVRSAGILVLAMGASLVVGLGFRAAGLSEINTVLVFLAGVVVVATFAGRGAAIAASALAVLLLNYFFVHPRHTFVVSDLQYLFTFAVLLAVGIGISELLGRLRHQAALALEREVLAAKARESALEAEAERIRADLLATVTHDLRTPLATILGTTSMLWERRDSLSTEVRTGLLRDVLSEAQRLARLLDNLLHLGRMEAGELAVRKEGYPLEEVLGAAIERVQRDEDAQRVRVRLSDDLPLVPVDADLVTLLFANLLDNALRYAPEGPIDVEARVRDGRVEVDVADRGPGLPGGDPEHLFGRFVRGERDRGRTEGSGLGLAICRAIARAHAGDLGAEDRAGGGARFRVALPLTEEWDRPGEAERAAGAQADPARR